MKNLKIKLSKATKLKNELENSIDEDNVQIQKWNSIIKGNEREINIDSIEELKDVKSEFLIELNIAIQEANFKKAKGEKLCNAYYIKKLSELNREKKHLSQIKTTNGTQVVGDKTVQYTTFLTSIDVNSKIKKIENEINSIKDKLTNFNNQFEISININTELRDIFDKVGIEL
jgi:hypothetical protein